jgi:hypothetical protein
MTTTRDALRPLEGRLVHCSGRLTRWQCHLRHGPGHADLLLTSVEVRLIDPEVPLLAGPPVATCDHLWMADIPTEGVELLQRLSGVGRVHWYTRKDGSIDLAVRWVESLPFDLILEELERGRGQGLPARAAMARHVFLEGMTAAREGKAWLESADISVVDALKVLGRQAEKLARDLEAERRAAFSQWTVPGSRRERRAADRAPRRSRQEVMA